MFGDYFKEIPGCIKNVNLILSMYGTIHSKMMNDTWTYFTISPAGIEFIESGGFAGKKEREDYKREMENLNRELARLNKESLEYKRAKTGKLYSVKVEPEAMAIIEKYKGVNYLVDIMDTFADYRNFLHRMGIALKQIGGMERVGRGGKKVRTPLFPELSSYWSRHTWATIAAELDIPKETISEALGHSIGSEVTSIYIKFDRKKVDEANRKVIGLINGE